MFLAIVGKYVNSMNQFIIIFTVLFSIHRLIGVFMSRNKKSYKQLLKIYRDTDLRKCK